MDKRLTNLKLELQVIALDGDPTSDIKQSARHMNFASRVKIL